MQVARFLKTSSWRLISRKHYVITEKKTIILSLREKYS